MMWSYKCFPRVIIMLTLTCKSMSSIDVTFDIHLFFCFVFTVVILSADSDIVYSVLAMKLFCFMCTLVLFSKSVLILWPVPQHGTRLYGKVLVVHLFSVLCLILPVSLYFPFSIVFSNISGNYFLLYVIWRCFFYRCSDFAYYTISMTSWVRTPPRRGAIDTTLCDKVCQWLAAGRRFSLGTPDSSTNKTDCHDITETLLKVALNTITLILYISLNKM